MSKRIDWRQRCKDAERELRRLRKLEHAAWHALDDAAEYPEKGYAQIEWRDWRAMSRLLPTVHP